MLRGWLLAVGMVGFVGCTEKLPGTTWEGSYKPPGEYAHETKIALAFEANDVAKLTLTEVNYKEPTTENLTYAFDGKALKLTGVFGVIKGTMALENGQLISTPADMALASAKEPKVVLTKKAE